MVFIDLTLNPLVSVGKLLAYPLGSTLGSICLATDALASGK